jgi:hypothetical protein
METDQFQKRGLQNTDWGTKFIYPVIPNECADYSEVSVSAPVMDITIILWCPTETVVLRQEWLLQIYGTASITSEEDEMMKKEREIIEILEKEERWRYSSNTTSEEKDIGEEEYDVLYCTSVA